jgi:hypothetical protein
MSEISTKTVPLWEKSSSMVSDDILVPNFEKLRIAARIYDFGTDRLRC